MTNDRSSVTTTPVALCPKILALFTTNSYPLLRPGERKPTVDAT